MSEKTIYSELSRIQKNLKAPKGQFNKFGGYHYRSCEDIMTGVKAILEDCSLVVTDSIAHIGDRFYIKATATLHYGDASVSSDSYAREVEQKKGMDAAQVTGSTSSYARKYALNALFAIDDTKDPDFQDNRSSGKQNNQKNQNRPPQNNGGRQTPPQQKKPTAMQAYNQAKVEKATDHQKDQIIELIKKVEQQVPNEKTIKWLNGLSTVQAYQQIQKFQNKQRQQGVANTGQGNNQSTNQHNGNNQGN